MMTRVIYYQKAENMRVSRHGFIGSEMSVLRFVPTLLGAGLLWSGTLWAATPQATRAQPPNIVFILADDLGLGHVGCYGQERIRTPNIDALAAEGMRFSNFYSGASVCAPARSTLMTGQHTGHTAVRNNGLKRHLYREDVTIAEVLKTAGYVTGGFGKWGLGDLDTPGAALKQGFDGWFGQYSQIHAHFHYPAFLLDGVHKYLLVQNEGKRRGQYAPDVIHERALGFVEANKTKPFFAFLSYTLPHVELTCPEDSWQAYRGKWPKIRRADPRAGYIGSEDAYAEFAGMVSRLDRQVGDVVARLKQLRLDDNTIVFFASDNGPQPGAWTDIFVDFFDGNGAFRGAKGSLYEGAIRVPFIVAWPGHIQPGSTSNYVGYFPDLMPTLAELAAAARFVPKAIDGVSIVPTLLSQPGKQKQHEYLYWETAGSHQDIAEQAVRWGRFKAVRPRGKAWELYDLEADPSETSNLAAAQPAMLTKLEALARKSHRPERKYPASKKESAEDYVR